MSPDLTFQLIASFRLVTANLERLTAFYSAIGFKIGETVAISRAEMETLELDGRGVRRPMALGDSRVELDSFDLRGCAYPDASNAADIVFQHLALVTDDAHAAWHDTQIAGAIPISRGGPVTLPQSSGGVTAVKFRDPEGHPLELLEFPAGSRSSWTGSGTMGIDHSAISVADIGTSRHFYEGRGLIPGKRTVNEGQEQVVLDDLDNVLVDVIPMNPSTRPPHVELLCYRRPTGRVDKPLAVNDVSATRIVWRSNEDALVRDPDGHLLQFIR